MVPVYNMGHSVLLVLLGVLMSVLFAHCTPADYNQQLLQGVAYAVLEYTDFSDQSKAQQLEARGAKSMKPQHVHDSTSAALVLLCCWHASHLCCLIVLLLAETM